MPEREFEITIAPNGEVELHVRGYKGRGCMEVARLFEKVVGELKDQQQTAEFYEPEEQVQYRVDQRR